MKLVAGLGNPGKKYEATRHNVGYRVVRRLAERHGQGAPRSRFQGEVVDAALKGEKVVLLSPTTYMNRSGKSVLAAKNFYKIEPQDVLVVCDDFSLPLGRLRMRPKGSAGGQKGLQDVIRCMGGEEVSRLRIGIGSPPESWDVADYVLSKFTEQEAADVEQAINRAADAVECWVAHGSERCMNEYNAA